MTNQILYAYQTVLVLWW